MTRDNMALGSKLKTPSRVSVHLAVEIDPRVLKPWPGNPRNHIKRGIEKLMESISYRGFYNPILADEKYQVLAGHGRLLAALRLEMEKVPCILLTGLSEAEKRAILVADNRLGEESTWDDERLAAVFDEIVEYNVDFDLGDTGFEAFEIVDIFDRVAPEDKSPDPKEDRLPPIKPDQPVVTQPGDIWICGQHRLGCGDARDEKFVYTLVGDTPAEMVITDPPYNVRCPSSGFLGQQAA